MDRIDELLARNDLTDEELRELERELVAKTREFHRAVAELTAQLVASDPQLARKLARAADNVLRNVEKTASLPWPDGSPGALAN